MISVNNLCVEFSARPLFEDVSFVVNDNDKIGLTGKNGVGKSTLLKILAGIESQTSGKIGKPKDITIGYLPQQMNIADNTTLCKEVSKAFDDLTCIKKELEQISQKIADSTEFNSSEYHNLLERQAFLSERLEIQEISNMEAEIESTLIGLGFKRDDFNRPTNEFSGGWRMRIELAKILLKKPDVLLLDEPTNHLDMDSIQWLENFLLTKAKAVILVSHDRAFLDNVTKRTIEISCGKAYDYKVSYSKFTELRKERVEQQKRAYENQQKQIADIEAFIERFRYQATKAVQVQSRIKQLEKIVPIIIDEVDNSQLRLKFPPAQRSGDFPLIAENVGKAYGNHQVFDHAEFMIRRGEKVAFVGKNGEGKTTLIKCIIGEISHSGVLKIGHNVKIGYFAQNQAQLLDEELTVFETIDNVATGEWRTKVRDLLGAFMFGGENIDKKVKVLSGGEKTRLAMIKLLLQPVNLLILDEPTNHLDLKTKDVLKEAIREFDGTVIIVSHDRYFLDGLVDKVYEIGGGRIQENLGGIYDFLRKKNLNSLKQLEVKSSFSTLKNNNNLIPFSEKNSLGKRNYEEQKEYSRSLSKTKKILQNAEKKVEEMEILLHSFEEKIANGDSSSETLKGYEETNFRLNDAMNEWEEASLKLEELENLNLKK